jgi:hypothetical protein
MSAGTGAVIGARNRLRMGIAAEAKSGEHPGY